MPQDKENTRDRDITRDTLLICGAGFLGGWFCRFYAQRAFAMRLAVPVVVLDSDVFEDRNLPTQCVLPSELGVFKTSVAADCLSAYGIETLSFPIRLKIDHLDTLFKELGRIIVVDSFDNIQSRLLAKWLAVRSGGECVHLSLSEYGFGKVEWSNKWSLDPETSLIFSVPIEVETPPCELPAFQQLGIQVAMRGAVEVSQYFAGSTTRSWFITEESQREL